jgi:hypothetical protein
LRRIAFSQKKSCAWRKNMGVETHVTLKRLFKACGPDFLLLSGDRGATVLSVEVLELQEVRRSVDCVIRLLRPVRNWFSG